MKRLFTLSFLAMLLFCGNVLPAEKTLFVWGYNNYGQIANWTLEPKNISSLKDVTSISASSQHTLAITSDGSLWAWGNNFFGQLGDGTTTEKSTPTQIGIDQNWIFVTYGFAHRMALKNDGTLWGWGNNDYGQLGDGTYTKKLVPTQIGANVHWTDVSCGSSFTIALADASTNVEESTINDNYNISLYPNPTKNKIELKINFSSATEADIKVYDLQSNELISVFAGNLPQGETKLQINCETLPNGTYNVVIQMKDKSITKRFVVAR